MLAYYSINTALVIVGFILIVLGGAAAYVSLGNHKVAKDWFGIWGGLIAVVVGIFLWWLTGSVHPEGFRFSLVGE